MDSAEASEGAEWGAIDVAMRNVELDDFFAGDGGSVLHANRSVEQASARELKGGRLVGCRGWRLLR